MGNLNEIDKIEELRNNTKINKKDKKKIKAKNQDSIYKFLHYEGNIQRISLIPTSPQIKEMLLENKYHYSFNIQNFIT